MFRLIFGNPDTDECASLIEQAPKNYGLVQEAVAAFDGSDEVDDKARHRAFLLWTFVHGLSFLFIDGKIEVGGLETNLEDFLMDVARRVLLEPPMPG